MNQETPFVSKRAPVAESALMAQLIDDKIDLQKRLDAAITALADQRDVSSRAHEAWLKAMSKIGDLEAEMDALKQLEPVAFINDAQIDEFLEDYEMIGENEAGQDCYYTPTEGDKALIKDAIFGYFCDAPSRLYSAAGAAGAQPTPMTPEEAEALAHRRCSRYIFIDTKAPYQFGPKDLLDFVRDIEKGTRV